MKTILCSLLAVLLLALVFPQPATAQVEMARFKIQNNTAFVKNTSDTSTAYKFGGAHHIATVFIVSDTVDVVREFQYRENSSGTWTEMARDSVVQLAAAEGALLQDEFVLRSAVADSVIKGNGEFRVIHRWKNHANNGVGGTFSEWLYAR